MLVESAPAIETSLSLADVALNTAIELDKNTSDETMRFWLTKFSSALQENSPSLLGLLPTFDRALTSSSGKAFTTKDDLFSKLKEIQSHVADAKYQKSADDVRVLLRDFCLALHDSLLNVSYVSYQKVVANSRVVA